MSRNAQKHMLKEIAALYAAHQRKYSKVILATLAAFVLSFWLTAKGLFDMAVEVGAADVTGIVTALMASVVAAILVGGGTMLLLAVVMTATRRQFWHIVVLAASLMPFTLGISTFSAVRGTAGPNSLVYDMRSHAIAQAVYYEQATTDTSGAQSAQAALMPLQASICGLAEGEGSNGVLTGSAGRGAVFAAYTSGCASIRTIIQTLADTVARTESRREEAAKILAVLSTIPQDTSLSVFERQSAFRLEVNKLRKLIEETGAENVSDRLTAQLKILQSSVATLGVQNDGFGKKQSGAIQNLKAAIGLVGQTVDELLNGDPMLRPEPPRELLETGAAVAVYWHRNIPQILLAVLIDLMPVWFTGLLMVSRTTVRTREEELRKKPNPHRKTRTANPKSKKGE